MSILKSFTALSFLLIMLGSHLYGQPYYFRHYQVENGLSNNAAICCLQDNKGFLWIGTKDGLNRFDGYSFKIFRHTTTDLSSIGSNFIHCLFEDKKGVLWVGTERGLYKFNASNESFTLLKATENKPIKNIIKDGKGNLWFIMGYTLCKCVGKNLKFYAYHINDYFDATSICSSTDGSIWVSSSNGTLKKYQDHDNSFESFDLFAHSKYNYSHRIEKVFSTAKGELLIGTATQGAKIFNTFSRTYKDILIKNSNKTELFVRNFFQTSVNEFWIATESGIFIYNSESQQARNLQKEYNDPYSISDNAVYCFCKDKEGGIWAGTYFGGINYSPQQYNPFKKLFPKVGENSISGNVVSEIHQDNSSNLWIGTEDAGLNKMNMVTGKFTHYRPTGSKKSITYPNIHGMLIHGNELWIGTFEHGLDVMNMRTGKIIQHYFHGKGSHDIKTNFIYFITQTDEGQILLGTARGAYTFNRITNDFSNLTSFPLNTWYSYLLKDRNGIIWAGTFGNGIIYFNTKTRKGGNFRYDSALKNGLPSDRINSIFEDSKKGIWFATESGLCKLDSTGKSFITYTVKNGFPGDFILSILEDAKENLWISTTKGLVCFNPKTKHVQTFNRINGTLNDQFNFNSAYKDASGRMYFGSVKGLISFNPAEFTENTFIPPVYITGFQVFNKDLSIAEKGSPLKQSIINTKKITLNYDQSTFSIDFAALSYTAPEMSEYAYIMDGLDKDWTLLKKNRKAYFTQLAPGDYVFRVKTANNSGVWYSEETKLIIQILPPWWLSNWAYAAYIFLIALISYFAIYRYHKYIKAINKRKFELLEIAKEKEIYEAKLNFFTNVAHEIRTPLTLIKAPLEKVIKKEGATPDVINNLKIMERNTNRLIALTNQLLDFRQTEINGFSLNFVSADISELLEETYNNFKPLAEQNKLSFQLYLPPNTAFAYIDLDAFNKILYNLFSNAIKYAQNKVLIHLQSFTLQDESFTIVIKNDGFIIPEEMSNKIFQPFFRLKETEKQKGTGIGLALSLSLTQLHNGKLLLLQPENGLNIFSLTLPFHQDH